MRSILNRNFLYPLKQADFQPISMCFGRKDQPRKSVVLKPWTNKYLLHTNQPYACICLITWIIGRPYHFMITSTFFLTQWLQVHWNSPNRTLSYCLLQTHLISSQIQVKCTWKNLYIARNLTVLSILTFYSYNVCMIHHHRFVICACKRTPKSHHQ